MKSQTERVFERMSKYGSISSLWAIHNYILRLASRVAELREAGFEIAGAYEVKGGKKTKNFVYTLVK